ncbi:Ankyrin repeat domain-containing protein 2 [Hondaea fermentalgiana]|uniref:Ankyrin repeat domain-containing protein 2 n=1 Tax=Hondaea fermentalgiana TaxID=2315210 RepID=A0A2R5GD31_9STRA|nr:Ankyrin repeat domain-containing protein 2 [Hondaea fermentalgiana]|eukprot:GBG28900.1 Ankyrin repeat domain-containing protein 2 [Hondaea fermentalgiana]
MVHAFRPREVWDAAADGDIKRLQQHIRARTAVYKPQRGGIAGVDEACPLSGWAPLHFAAANGRLQAVKLLLEHGADVWIRTRTSGETPLHLAARNGHVRLVKLLLACCDGIKELVNDLEGNSVVHAACVSNKLAVVRVFFDSLRVKAVRSVFEECLDGELAPDAQLFVASRDLSPKVAEGDTFVRSDQFEPQSSALESGSLRGRPCHASGSGENFTFQPGIDARQKPRSEWTMNEFGMHVVPAMLAAGHDDEETILVRKLADDGNAGQECEGVYVICAGSARLADVVDVLETSFSDDDFIWLEAFGVDQVLAHGGTRTCPPAVAIVGFDEVAVVCDTWESETLVRNARTVWQLLVCIYNEKPLRAMYSLDELSKFTANLLKESSARALVDSLGNGVDLQALQDLSAQDREAMDKVVAAAGSYEKVNRKLTLLLRTWACTLAQDAVASAREPGHAPVYLVRILVCAGFLMRHQGKTEEALELYVEAYNIVSGALGPHHQDTLHMLSNLGDMSRVHGRFDEALEYYEMAFKGMCALRGPRHAAVARLLTKVGVMHSVLGQYKEAEEAFEEVLEIRRDSLGARHIAIADLLQKLGMALFAQERYEEALRRQQEALDIEREVLGRRHVKVAGALTLVGVILSALKKFDEARSHLQQALEIRREAGLDNEVASTLKSIGRTYAHEGRLNAALAQYNEALRILEECASSDASQELEVASMLGRIASVYTMQNRLEEALQSLERALEIRRDISGNKDLEVAHTLREISELCFARGERGKAFACAWEAEAIYVERLGEAHLTTKNLRAMLQAQENGGSSA